MSYKQQEPLALRDHFTHGFWYCWTSFLYCVVFFTFFLRHMFCFQFCLCIWTIHFVIAQSVFSNVFVLPEHHSSLLVQEIVRILLQYQTTSTRIHGQECVCQEHMYDYSKFQPTLKIKYNILVYCFIYYSYIFKKICVLC